MRGSRFFCPSVSLELRALRNRGRRLLWIALGLALGAHIALTQWRGLMDEQKTVRPLTTQFIKRRPRLTKPLELKKRPRPKQRRMRRKMVAVKARTERQQTTTTLLPVEIIGQLTRPEASLSRTVSFEATALEPGALAQAIESTKEAKQMVDMSLEMVDIAALDTGEYHAMVIQDPNDKQNIRGFFHVAIVYSRSMRERSFHDLDTRQRRAILRLVEAMNRYTQIKTDVLGYYTFDSDEFLKTPWIYALVRRAFKLTVSEAANCGRYMTGGGMVFIDFVLRADEPSSRKMAVDALATQGLAKAKDWHWETLPNNHPLYHCFFDFPEGPPVGCYWKSYGGSEGARMPWGYLEAVMLEHRIVALLGDQRYANAWGDWGREGVSSTYAVLDPTRPLQFGVNLLIFALTQEGSITRQVMDRVQ